MYIQLSKLAVNCNFVKSFKEYKVRPYFQTCHISLIKLMITYLPIVVV